MYSTVFGLLPQGVRDVGLAAQGRGIGEGAGGGGPDGWLMDLGELPEVYGSLSWEPPYHHPSQQGAGRPACPSRQMHTGA